jgi:hypothetical protein
MGLDIYAYRKLTKLDVLFDSDGGPVDPTTREPVEDCYRVYANPDFPSRADGLEDRACYSYADAEHVFSRSYGGYNLWRETLAKLAGYPLDYSKTFGEPSHAAAAWNGKVRAGAPFWELVNFADNEGTIGPVVAAKLLRDFADFDEMAKAVIEDGFYDGYCDIRKGLEFAADGGALDFS